MKHFYRRLRQLVYCSLFVFTGQSVVAQNVCPPNIDFGFGDFTNWQCYAGSVALTGGQNVVTVNPTAPLPNRHTLISPTTQNDVFGGFPMTPDNNPVVRLGFNGSTGSDAERVTYTFTIPSTSTNYSLTYKYAVVYQNPQHTPVESEPKFEARVFDVTTGQYINCASYTFYYSTSSSVGFLSPPGNPNVRYKPWTPVTFVLSDYIGHTIRIEFTNADCTFGGHWAYCYVDVVNSCSSPVVGGNFCPGDPSVSLTAPYGYQSYNWFNSGFGTPIATTPTLTLTPPPAVQTPYAVEVIPYPGLGCRDTIYATVKPYPVVPVNAGQDRILCPGNSNQGPSTLGSPAITGHTYSWSPAAGLNDATIAQPIATPTTTTDYILTMTDTATGCQKKDTVTVSVAPTLSGTFTINTPNQCLAGNSYQFTSSTANAAGTVFNWTFGGGVANSSQANPTISYPTPGNYTVKLTVTNSSGCIDSSSQNVIVSAGAVADAGADKALCASGGSVVIGTTSLTGYSYSWSPSTGLSNAAIAQPTASPSTTTTYILTATAPGNCIKTDTVVVNVSAPITAAFTVNNATQCLTGNSFQFNSSSSNPSGVTYAWDLGNGSSTQQNPSSVYTTANTYTVKLVVSSAGGSCKDSSTQNITVNPMPVANAGADQLLCGGTSASATIGTAAVTGYTYSWSPAAGLNNSTAAQPVASPTTTTNYIVTVTGAGGCITKDTVTVNVTSAITGVFTINNSTQCLTGNNFQFNINNPSGLTYNWDFGVTGGTSSQQNPSYAYASPGTYTVKVKVSGSGSCADSSTQTVTVNPMPVADAGADKLLCGGTSSNTVIGTPAVAGYSYSWSPAAGLSSATAAQPTAAPTATTNYILTVTGAGGCITKDTVTVNVTAAITGVFTVNNASQCLTGNNFQFNINNPSGLTYNWNFGVAGGTSTQQNPSYAYTATGTYTVKVVVSGSGGCADSSTQTVTVNAMPVADAGTDKLLCGGTGSSTQIGTAAVTGYTYSWSPAAGLSSTNVAQPNASPTATTDYIVSVTGAGGCVTKDTVRVTVTQALSSGFTVNNANQCITGNNFQFNVSNPVAGLTYSWNFGDNQFSTQQNPSHTYAAAGSYTVKVNLTSANGCKDSSTQTVTVSAVPTATLSSPGTIICEGTPVVLTATGTTATTYKWYKDGVLVATTTTNTYGATQAGTYTFTLDNGCLNNGTGSITLTLTRKPTVDFSFSLRCLGFPATFTDGSNVSGSLPVNYSWNFGTTSIPNSTQATPPAVTYPTAGTYNVQFTVTPQNCPSLATTATKPVTVKGPTPNTRYPDKAALENVPLQLQARNIGSSYAWSPGTNLNNAAIMQPIFNGVTQQDYTITITDNLGCVTVDSQLVKVFKEVNIFVPKAFTPNGDAQNDRMFPLTIGIKQVRMFRIINRWGVIVYEAKTDLPGWDGLYKGAPQPMDGYVWELQAVDYFGKMHTRSGTFTLIR